MLLGSASKQKMFLLWLLATLPSALIIAAQSTAEAGDVVDVTVVANAYGTRADNVVGCRPDGCTPENTRDGDLRDVSRWSCSRELVAAWGGADGEECRIVYEFSDALAVVESVSVAFYRGAERARAMNVEVNGVQVTVIESGGVTSEPETFELGVQDVQSIGLESVGLPEDDDFLSIIEVTFRVSEVGVATPSPFGAATPSPTFSSRDAGPAPSSSSECGGGSSEDQTCSNGLPGYESSNVCCPLSCGRCGGRGCSTLGDGCCIGDVRGSGELCSETKAAPCKIDDDGVIFVDDDGAPCLDGTTGGTEASVDDSLVISARGAWIAVGIVTAANVARICMARMGSGDTKEVVHAKLILWAFLFSTVEGIALVALVPSSQEGLRIGGSCFFGLISALSALLLRKARWGVRYSIFNAILEAGFALVTLFVFVERSMANSFLFVALAANEALVGFAMIGLYESSPTESPGPIPRNHSTSSAVDMEEVRERAMMYVEAFFVIYEALGDTLAPVTWILLRSQFHPDSEWRSDAVFILFSITGSVCIAFSVVIMMPPISELASQIELDEDGERKEKTVLRTLGFGAKAKAWVMGLANLMNGVMSFALLYMTERDIEDPPTFEVVWSSVCGTSNVLVFFLTIKAWKGGVNNLDNDAREVLNSYGGIKKLPDGATIEGWMITRG